MVNQFYWNFHSKTLGCRKMKSVFRNVKWCFNASWGLKRPFVPKSGVKHWFTTTTLQSSMLFTYMWSLEGDYLVLPSRFICRSFKIRNPVQFYAGVMEQRHDIIPSGWAALLDLNSADIYCRRQNLTSKVVRFWRLKSIPHCKSKNMYNGRRPIT